MIYIASETPEPLSYGEHIMRIAILAALVGLSALAAPAARADILDIAIEIIKPELKPAKTVLLCAIKGKLSVLECATAGGMAEVAKEPLVRDVLEAYGYADRKEWPKLVAKVGVTAACTAFEIPAKEVFCDEYAKYVVKYGAKIIEAHAVVAKEVGVYVANLVKDGAAVLTCAVGFSCPSSTKNPNEYVVTMPGGMQYSIQKFNLDQMWTACYATRIEEGISTRIANTVKFQRMVAAPSTRLGNTNVLDDDALGRNCIVKIEADAGLDYYERQQGIYARGWDPYAEEMNAKWRDMIFVATAETLEHPADIFLKSSDNWVKLRSIVVAQDKWDRPIIKGVYAGETAECLRAVEFPASSVAIWSEGAAKTEDSSVLEGVPAAQWAAKVRGWCAREYIPALRAKVEMRIAAKAKAIAAGCTQKPEGGLSCPAAPAGSYIAVGLDQCKIAYSGRGDACTAVALRAASPPVTAAPPVTAPNVPFILPRAKITVAPVTAPPETAPPPPSPPAAQPLPRLKAPVPRP